MQKKYPTTSVREVIYGQCPVCGSLRIGYAARGWPKTATVCPKCSDLARQVRDFDDADLSPSREDPS